MRSPRASVALLALLGLSCGGAPAVPSWPESPERDDLRRLIEAELGLAPDRAAVLDAALGSRNAVVRSRAVLALVRTRAGGAAARCRELVAGDRHPEVRRQAAWALGELGLELPAATALRAAAALDVAAAVRAAAVLALGRDARCEAVQLSSWLEDPDPEVRQAAAAAAGTRAVDGAALLAPRLVLERDERVRWQLYAALSGLPGCTDAVRPHLEAAVRDPNFLVAGFALRGLEPCPEADPRALLLGLEEDRSFWLPRAIALRALAARRDRGALPPEVRLALEARVAMFGAGGLDAGEYPLLRSLATPARSGDAPAPAAGPGAALPATPAGPILAALSPRAVGLVGLRHPRAVIRFAGKGAVTLELYALDAPRHVSAFAELARAGAYDGRALAAVDPVAGVRLALPPLAGGAAAVPLPLESSPVQLRRGAVLAADAAGRPDATPGALSIAHLPPSGLQGQVTCWGAVLLGMELIDRLEPGDRIERVELASP